MFRSFNWNKILMCWIEVAFVFVFFNVLLRQCIIIPDCWKIQLQTVMFRVRKTTNISSFRHISLSLCRVAANPTRSSRIWMEWYFVHLKITLNGNERVPRRGRRILTHVSVEFISFSCSFWQKKWNKSFHLRLGSCRPPSLRNPGFVTRKPQLYTYWINIQWRIKDLPEEGAPTPHGEAPTYDFAILSKKLHEIERIWTPGEACIPRAPPLDPPLISSVQYLLLSYICF